MKEQLLGYLKSICSSSKTIAALSKISDDQASEILTILEKFDLDDAVLFYIGTFPEEISKIKKDLNGNGVIGLKYYNSIMISCYQNGYV